jgi:hypothetical protein
MAFYASVAINLLHYFEFVSDSYISFQFIL